MSHVYKVGLTTREKERFPRGRFIPRLIHIFFITAIAAGALALTSGSGCKSPTQPGDTTKIDTTHTPPADTTSHNFTWTLDTIGVSGYFDDIFIINDTDAYAVGRMWGLDSTGHKDVGYPYNVAHWNGSQWKMMRIPIIDVGNYTDSLSEFYCVFAFSPNDVWCFSDAGSYAHWDGKKWSSKFVTARQGGVFRMWGTSSSDMYFVGNNGEMTHYNGTTFTLLTSGTTLDFSDIWGAKDSTGNDEILAVANNAAHTIDRYICRIQGNTVTQIPDTPITNPLTSVWFMPGRRYFVSGSGIYEKNRLSDSVWMNKPAQITSYFSSSIRGNDTNDVVAAGGYGDVVHYNGRTWVNYDNATGMSGNYYSVSIRGNLIMAAGESAALQAIVAIGRR